MDHHRGIYAHRAVAPVIATLLLIAIAVVGGTIISIYSQEIIISAQVSGGPSIELVKFLGYDTRDASVLVDPSEIHLQVYSGGYEDNFKTVGERVAIYVQNHSVNTLVINELRLAGNVYTFTENVDTLGFYITDTAPATGEFVILLDAPNVLLDSSVPYIEPGQTVSLIISLDEVIKIGREAQLKITSNHGSTFVGTATIGELRL
jgi:archaeal type IV pilus assembly protein PilA